MELEERGRRVEWCDGITTVTGHTLDSGCGATGEIVDSGGGAGCGTSSCHGPTGTGTGDGCDPAAGKGSCCSPTGTRTVEGCDPAGGTRGCCGPSWDRKLGCHGTQRLLPVHCQTSYFGGGDGQHGPQPLQDALDESEVTWGCLQISNGNKKQLRPNRDKGMAVTQQQEQEVT